MLECRNLTLTLLLDGRNLVKDFSFTLQRGDKAVIIGEEGNGKSTLLKTIYNADLTTDYCEMSGQIITKAKLAYLPQSLPESDLSRTLAEYYADVDVFHHLAVLRQIGIDPELTSSSRTLGSFSGGERIRLEAAHLLSQDPDILLLDEPTNDLDLEALEWMEQLISSTELPVLYISHDETLIERTANVILHLELTHRKQNCKITVARVPYSEYLARRSRDMEHQDQVAAKQREDYRNQMERYRKIRDKVDHQQRTISRQDPSGGRLLKKKMHSVLSMGARFEREKENFTEFTDPEKAILTKFDPSIRIPAGKTVLETVIPELTAGGRGLSRNVSLTVRGPAHVGIIGRNGSGKTTLLRRIREELAGRRDIHVFYMPQDYQEVLEYDRNPIDYLAGHYAKADVTRARTFMGNMRFTPEEMLQPIRSLSGGQKAKILFLEAVLRGSEVLLLDEPTRNFSPLSAPVIRETLQAFGGTIISISHDRKYLAEVCDTLYELTPDGLVSVRPDRFE
jgi:ATPase subunit of ABC transporter with duplicated ATPase domains